MPGQEAFGPILRGIELSRRILVAVVAAMAVAAGPAYASAPIQWTSLTPISPGGSPYTNAATCAGSSTGVQYLGTEVEPWIATNPVKPGNSVAVWQQDRYSNGGANSLR